MDVNKGFKVRVGGAGGCPLPHTGVFYKKNIILICGFSKTVTCGFISQRKTNVFLPNNVVNLIYTSLNEDQVIQQSLQAGYLALRYC